jgi:hypothetical protein
MGIVLEIHPRACRQLLKAATESNANSSSLRCFSWLSGRWWHSFNWA